jgi:membrane-bound serine protease (ClpP class)
MKRKPYRLAALILLAAGAGLTVSAQAPSGGVYVLAFQDAIGPATSDYIVKGLDEAIAADAELVVIEMNTPGGLDTSMRDIIQAILDSPVPVASYVAPGGSRAASAGTFILYASHIAAMAPATNLGAATPVEIGGGPPASPADEDALDDNGSEDDPAGESEADTSREREREPSPAYPEPTTASERKAINDAVAYIRSLAELRGRNADWAEAAVRGAESLSARAALEAGVIDIIATDRNDLLRQLDGRVVDGNALSLPPSILITVIEPDWRSRLLSVITNPTIAYMLMLLGAYGLLFEGYNPGAIVPGVVGAISILLALFAFQILPVNYAGLALMLLGLILMVAEFFVPSFGALGIGGIAAFVFGSLILIDTDVPGFEVATSAIAGIAFAGSLAMMATIWVAMRARERRIVSGIEEMAGLPAEALEDFDGEGHVWVHGERWRARAAAPVSKGQELTVTGVEGLLLRVEPVGHQ